MRTFSHALVTAVIGRKAEVERGSLVAFVVGSVLPDLPVGVLTIVANLQASDMGAAMVAMDRALSSSFWLTLHNVPHSLVVMGALSLLGYVFSKRRWARWLLWYAAGATLHIVFDIFTHATDGPLFLYPLSQLRFSSPVSYWDPVHYGQAFTLFEYLLDFGLVLYLLLPRQRRRTSLS